jgi:hypothetical protein
MPVPEQHDEISTSQMSTRPALLSMQDELMASQGYRAVALMDRVKRIAYILQANLRQYNSLVATMHKPEVAFPILDVRNEDAHDELLSEAERLLHNVVVAIKTRVDHLRVFINKHFSDDAEFLSEYRARVTADFDNLPTKFLDKLRNHMTHHLLPVARSQQTLTHEEPFQFTFVLDSASLLEWDWPAGVKPWIEQQGSYIKIVNIVDDYGKLASRLDKWLYDRIEIKYRGELKEYRAAAEIFNREVDRVFGF